jgi:hypothetical protein
MLLAIALLAAERECWRIIGAEYAGTTTPIFDVNDHTNFQT